MMVRRRPRTGKMTATTTEVINGTSHQNGAGNNHLLDEQYFASPKRKDCKIESTPNGEVKIEKKTNSAKSRQERAAARVIGVPLATRSQTRTIETFFKASAKLKAATTTASKELCETRETKSEDGACYYDLCGDDTTNDTDTTECSDEAQLPFEMAHKNMHLPFDIPNNNNNVHDIDSAYKLYDTCENIFLQKPVLKLNVDDTVRHMPISKGLELEPVFSSPSTLNGRFKIVSLNAQQVNMLPDNDNSSCDSGVAFSACSVGNNSPPHNAAHIIASPLPVSSLNNGHINRRRKPNTPHRIVCPSPVKSMPVLISPMAHKFANGMSPRKSQRQIIPTMEQADKTNAVVGNKTRRRLNHQYQQQVHQHTQKTAISNDKEIAPELVKIEIDSDDEIKPNEIKKEVIVKKEEDDKEDIMSISSTSTIVGVAESTAEKKEQEEKVAIKTEQKSTNTITARLPATNLTAKVVAKKPIKTEPGKKIALPNGGNRELSEFFPVRRSVRKTKTVVKEEMMRTLEQAILEERNDGLRVEYFDGKGRGVLTTRVFMRGEFVVEYVGDLISMTEAAKREQKYALDENAGCYMYYFKHKNQQYCIDATADTGKLGRLINHSRNGNLMTKVVVVKQRPHLILIAKDDIAEGEELCYDYGDRSKESLLHHPWLAY